MRKLGTLAVTLALAASTAQAQRTIAAWDQGGRSWFSSSEFTTIRSAVAGRGHTVAPDMAISAPNLAGVDVFMLTELTTTPSAAELATLSTWMTGGGRLLVMFDSFVNTSIGNAALAGLGSGMSASGSQSNGPAVAGNFATEGPPFNLVGQTIDLSLGFRIVGGTTLIGNFLGFEQMGSGFIYVFGDRVDHNFASPTATDGNGQLFINIIEGGAVGVVPEPATVMLVAMGILLLAGARARQRR